MIEKIVDAFHFVLGILIVYTISFIFELSNRWSYIPKNTTFIPRDVWPEVEEKKPSLYLVKKEQKRG